ncbi:MAG: hypothetical protein ACI31G_00205 [Bacilli bacterium]
MDLKNQKLEPRGEKDHKFNIHNKTDKKILIFVILTIVIGIILIVLLSFLAINNLL